MQILNKRRKLSIREARIICPAHLKISKYFNPINKNNRTLKSRELSIGSHVIRTNVLQVRQSRHDPNPTP